MVFFLVADDFLGSVIDHLLEVGPLSPPSISSLSASVSNLFLMVVWCWAFTSYDLRRSTWYFLFVTGFCCAFSFTLPEKLVFSVGFFRELGLHDYFCYFAPFASRNLVLLRYSVWPVSFKWNIISSSVFVSLQWLNLILTIETNTFTYQESLHFFRRKVRHVPLTKNVL